MIRCKNCGLKTEWLRVKWTDYGDIKIDKDNNIIYLDQDDTTGKETYHCSNCLEEISLDNPELIL